MIVDTYLDLLDSQRETAFSSLIGLREQQIWQRQSPGEWSIGEILNHNYLLIASTMPYVRFAWRYWGWYGIRRKDRPYKTEIPDLYRTGKFPMWVGFLWTPRYNAKKNVSLVHLQKELRDLHREVRVFYAGKDEALLGNVYLYDPYFGCLNLILTLRLGIYHDQLHFDDVEIIAKAFAG